MVRKSSVMIAASIIFVPQHRQRRGRFSSISIAVLLYHVDSVVVRCRTVVQLLYDDLFGLAAEPARTHEYHAALIADIDGHNASCDASIDADYGYPSAPFFRTRRTAGFTVRAAIGNGTLVAAFHIVRED
jgi:hypothetical protein